MKNTPCQVLRLADQMDSSITKVIADAKIELESSNVAFQL